LGPQKPGPGAPGNLRFGEKEIALPRPTVGQRAPDFTLPNAEGKPVRLGELLAQKIVVLYFYPKDETAGCTAEACAFRDAYEDFAAAGAEVVGISRDDAASHTRFAAHHKLPFTLLGDADGTVHALYGIQTHLGFLRDRVTFVIDRSGIVRKVFSSMIDMRGHVESSLPVVRELIGQAAMSPTT
jgi:peroxiredoxin Q/BCP